MKIEQEWFNHILSCPYYEEAFLREVVPNFWHFEDKSFSVTEHGRPLALVPLFVKKGFPRRATMSPMYASGPVFCLEMSLKRRIKVAKFVRENLHDIMRRESLWFIQFSQNVFFQPMFQGYVDLGHMISDFKSTSSALVLKLGSEDDMMKRMEPSSRTSIRRAMRMGIAVEHKVLEPGDVPSVDSLNAEAKASKGYPGQEGRMRYLEKMCRSGKIHLFRAHYENRAVAYLLAHVWKGYAYYSDAGVVRGKANAGASNLLQWEAMKFLRNRGDRWYDLSLSWLMSDNREKESVSAFKRSLGAEEIPFCRGVVFHPTISRQIAKFGRFR